jgi:hypothetical protein
LGTAFVVLLVLSSVENTFFFGVVSGLFQSELPPANKVVAQVAMLFIHNVLVVSLILLGMAFYVNLVMQGFFKREKYATIVLDHSRTFALVFTIMIIFLSILRGSSLLGGITVEALPLVLLISTPIGMVEGYGIYSTIEKTLSRTMTMRDLGYIYGIFFVAALMEVSFINILIWVTR